jgi:prepilin-type N-terminal cleavage/methylation domain-containing protein
MSKIKRGFTLIEVIVSIALLGILAVAFLPSITGHFKWLVDTKTNITQKAFKIQDDMETAIQTVVNAMDATGAIDSDDYDSLGITGEVSKILFESDSHFTAYTSRVSPKIYKVEVGDGGKKFVTLVGSKRLPELPVPKIVTVSRVFIKDGAESASTHEYFNYPDLKIRAKSNMTENPSNSFNRYRSDWYVSKPGFIIPMQGIIDEDNDLGRIYPSFPDDYIAAPIHSELGSDYSFISATERNISVDIRNDMVNQYPGRHISYTITPFAKSLKKGVTAYLQPLYIYGPSVTTNLSLHLDASTINMGDVYNASTNPGGTLIIDDNGTVAKEDDIYGVRTWKNSRPSVKTENTNLFKAIQDTEANRPVLVKDNIFSKPEIPFQSEVVDGETIYSVWGRALGNKTTTVSNMAITGIGTNINNVWSMFIVMRRVDAPLAPTSGPIIKNNSGTNWSLGWVASGGDLNLQLSSAANQITLPTSTASNEWLLIHAKSTLSGMSLKASSLMKGGTYVESVSGSGTIDINDINIVFNGVEISEILIYNADMTTETTNIETYLTEKYNPD